MPSSFADFFDSKKCGEANITEENEDGNVLARHAEQISILLGALRGIDVVQLTVLLHPLSTRVVR